MRFEVFFMVIVTIRFINRLQSNEAFQSNLKLATITQTQRYEFRNFEPKQDLQ